MTAFLKLNGIEIPVADDSARHSPLIIGEQSKRAVDGTGFINRRAIKREWEFDVVLQAASTALVMRDLILGRGHHFSFDSHLYSSKGLPPVTVTSASQTTSQAKYGAGSLSCTAGAASVTWPNALPAAVTWTVSYWHKVDAGAWQHIVENGDGERYVNGVGGFSADFVVSVVAGTLTVDGSAMTGTTSYIDDLWVTPGLWPATWPAGVYGLGVGVGAAGKLKASGLLIENNAGAVEVTGEVSELPVVQGNYGGAWHANLHRLAVKLSEV